MNTITKGTKIGNYVLQSLIGKGGMGSVFLAEHPEIGRQVAIKFLSPHLSHQPGISDRFVSEAKAVSRIDHANIIHIYDFGRMSSGQLYYVMELLHGEELSATMKRGVFEASEIAPYLGQICAGLFAAHRQGVVHRDLKPQNIFVLNRQPLALKILDFGIAKIIETEEGAGSLTATGAVLGSPLFISPEQAMGRPDLITAQTDIYSLGIILYWMLTGRPPFRDMPTALLMAKHIEVAPPPVRTFAPSVPEAVAKLVERCLAKDPAGRPESARTLFAEYVEACELDAAVLPSHFSESLAGVTLPVRSIGELDTYTPDGMVAHISTGADNIDSAVANSETVGLSSDELLSVTTLGGSAGEISILSAAPRSRPSLQSLGLGLGVLALGAVVVFAFGDFGGDNRPSAATRTNAPAEQLSEKPRASKAAPARLVPLIEIESRDAVGQCSARLDGKWLPLRDTPCRYKAKPGQNFQVRVQAGEQTPFDREFIVAGDRRFVLRSSDVEHRLMVAELAPAAEVASAEQVSSSAPSVEARRGSGRKKPKAARMRPAKRGPARSLAPNISARNTAQRGAAAARDEAPNRKAAAKELPAKKELPGKAEPTPNVAAKPVKRSNVLGEGTSPF